MKNVFIGCLLLLNTGCALASPPDAKLTVHVVDMETNLSITNAVIYTDFTQQADPWGLGIRKSTRIKKQVNSDGLATVEGQSIYSARGGSVFAEGYYSQMFTSEHKKNVLLNRWEPWNPTIEVKMRPKKDPVPMVTKRVESLKITTWNKPIGFDLEKGDWVAPHGKGNQADFFVNMHRRFEHSGDYDAMATITFPNDGDGIQLYENSKQFETSSFKFPYEAPTHSYQNQLVLERHATLRETNCSFDPENDLYIFRVRTKKDEDGNIILANYGRMGRIEIGWGEVFDTSYWFNPDPHSRSLESLAEPH